MSKEIEWLLREKYDGEKSDAFFADCARLEAGEPLAYIIGTIPFLDCTIHLDSHPLIPRPETEYWVEKAIVTISSLRGTEPKRSDATIQGNASKSAVMDKILIAVSGAVAPPRNDDEPFPRGALGFPSGAVQVLDLCAGSGAIGVAVAKAIPEATVTFAEIDPALLPTIKKNLETNLGHVAPYEILQSDLFQNVTGTFDFILTNPPYIDKAADTVDASVEAHEPKLALFGGVAGMEIIERIIAGARAKLAPRGQLWIEHEPFQCEAIAVLAAEHHFAVSHQKDQYDTYRYSVLSPLVAE